MEGENGGCLVVETEGWKGKGRDYKKNLGMTKKGGESGMMRATQCSPTALPRS